MQQDTPIMGAVRAILTLLGTLLIGHVVVAGHPLTTDLWQLILGAAMTIVGGVTEFLSANTTPTQIQSIATSIGAALGGVLLALGLVNQQTWTSIMGVVAAVLPLIHKQSTKTALLHLSTGKAKMVGQSLKKVAVIILLLGFGTIVHAQEGCDFNPSDSVKYISQGVWNLPMDVMKDAARQSYFKVLDMLHNQAPYTKGSFDTALNHYDYWSKLILTKLNDNKARSEFYNRIVSEARAAGKLTYKEDKPVTQINSPTEQYSYVSNITPATMHGGNGFNYWYNAGLELPSYFGRRQNYSTGFKFFFKHKPDLTHLHMLSGKLGDPPMGADTTTYQGWEPVASVVVYAYSPVLKTWVSLGGVGIAYSKYIWKKSSTSSGRWYCQWSIAGLGYGGGGLVGSTPTTPTNIMGVGALGASVSLFDKHLSVGGGYDIINKGGLLTVGTSFSFLN